jgi:hypothetical protein
MNNASEAVLALKPVIFHYKSDKRDTPQFGLIAEEVAKVNPDLVVRDKNGEIYTVRYEAVNAMLLNEFLKEHRKVQEQEAMIAQLKKDFRATVVQLSTRLDEQAAQIQKVSARIKASKPAPQVVNNPESRLELGLCLSGIFSRITFKIRQRNELGYARNPNSL